MEERKVFGNPISKGDHNKAVKEFKKYQKQFKNAHANTEEMFIRPNPVLKPVIGLDDLTIENTNIKPDYPSSMIIGNIRMGYGHYRIAIAIASAVKHAGFTPLWFDLLSFKGTKAASIVDHLNSLYSLGSRLSQKYSLFNKYYWEPLNSIGFKSIAFNYKDRYMCRLMTDLYNDIPKNTPFIGTHAWSSLSAVNAGMKNVVNVIPDNWPMGLHLCEGAIHTVQTHSSYLGYMVLREMDPKKKTLTPIPSDKIFNTGHYIDHEIVSVLKESTEKRLNRIKKNLTKTILMTIGGAGAQSDLYLSLLESRIAMIKQGSERFIINMGDHRGNLGYLLNKLNQYKDIISIIDGKTTQIDFDKGNINIPETGITVIINDDIFKAVYFTNYLMPDSDLLITKPSELAFYPIPKLMVKRVGGHEAWGAIRSSEIGDGTIECENTPRAIQMLNLILDDKKILTALNQNIEQNHSIGVYNGAYKVVELALKGVS